MHYETETPQWKIWVKSSGWDTLEPHLLVPFTTRLEMVISAFEIKQLEVQRMLPKRSCLHLRWNLNESASILFAHCHKKEKYIFIHIHTHAGLAAVFPHSFHSFSKYAKSTAEGWNITWRELKQHEKPSPSKSKSNHIVHSHPLSLSLMSWHADIILTWIPVFIPVKPVSHRGSHPPESNAGE